MRTTTIAAATLMTLAGTANAQVIDWNNTGGGLWIEPTNWTPNNVPDTAVESAVIAAAGAYDVLVTIPLTVGSLSLSNPAASVTIDLGDTLTVAGGITNQGLIVVNPSAGGAVTGIAFDAAGASLAGTGSLRLNGFSTRARLFTLAGADIIHGADHRVVGYGLVEAIMENNGLIDADVSAQSLSMTTEDVVNNNTMRASNNGTLDLSSFVLTQGPAGLIVADAGHVRMSGIDLIGGTIDTINAGTFRVYGASSFDAVTVDGDLIIEIGDAVDVTNDLVNNASLTVNNSAGGAVTTLAFLDASTLGGSGEVVLNGFDTRARMLANSGTLTHQAPHSIRGFGRIEGVVDNNAPITADVTSQAINFPSTTINNTATLRATNSGVLDFNNSTVNNTGGGVIVADAGTVLIAGSDINDGLVRSINGGVLTIDGSSGFDAVTVNGDLTLNIAQMLTINNDLVNNGSLLVNNSAGGAVTSLFFEDGGNLTGNGEVILNGFSTRARIISGAGQTVTQTATHTIRGHGQIATDMVNNSTITADILDQQIFFDSVTIDNNQAISSLNGGILDFNTSVIDNQTGVIRADASTALFAGTRINGGTIEAPNAGTLTVDNSSTFDGVTVEHDLTLNIAQMLTINNDLVNNGSLLVNNSAGGAVTSLFFEDGGNLTGNGEVILNGFSTRARIISGAGQTVTQTATHTIRGHGQIATDMVNNSTITADILDQQIFFDSVTIDNNQAISSLNGGILDFNTSVIDNQTGVIRADASTALFAGTRINGGTIEAPNDGTLTVDSSSTFDGVTVEHDLTLNVAQALTIENGLINNGSLTINNNAAAAVTTMVFDGSSTLSGNGSVTLNGFDTLARMIGSDGAVVVTQGPDHSILGAGRVGVALLNNGTIAPGFSVGEMNASADITNTDSAVFNVEVAGNDNADLIDSSAAYHADGTITIDLIDGFDPADYWGASVVQADAGVTGRYDTIVADPPLDTRLAVRVRYLPNEIRVGAVCKPDINFDGELNFFDISAFISLFNVQDPDADIAAPFGAWNFFDIVAYIAQYNTGCP